MKLPLRQTAFVPVKIGEGGPVRIGEGRPVSNQKGGATGEDKGVYKSNKN